MASNPINELNLAIKPNTLQVGKKYTFAFRATRLSGAYGECRTTVTVNSPPVGGKRTFFPIVCSIYASFFRFVVCLQIRLFAV